VTDKLKAPRLRWRRVPRHTGLMAIGQGERGYELRSGERHIGSACPKFRPFTKDRIGYFWAVGNWEEWDMPNYNTSGTPVETIDEAKDQLMEYVKEHVYAKLLKESNG
jgi:hypothetical protein